MSKFFRFSSVFCTLTALSTIAAAQGDGLYFGVAGGLNLTENSEIKRPLFANNKADFDAGWSARASIGYGFQNGLRLEAEGNIRGNDVSSVSGPLSAGGTGDTTGYTAMANVLYDFDTGTRFTPYFGLGFGVTHLEVDNLSTIAATTVNGSDSALAYQLIGGVSYALTDHVHTTLDYRYIGSNKLEIPMAVGGNAEFEYDNHTIMLGLSYSFGKPGRRAAHTVSRSAPMASTNYDVSFDYDSTDLDETSKQTVLAAASDIRRGRVVRLMLDGQSDVAGSRSYNVQLAKKRASSVESELNRLGIPSGKISVLARNNDGDLEPTGDRLSLAGDARAQIVMN